MVTKRTVLLTTVLVSALLLLLLRSLASTAYTPDAFPVVPQKGAVQERYFMVAFIEQQLASATNLGLQQVLRTAALLKRTAVLPRARFDEPSYRTTTSTQYYELDLFYNTTTMLAPWRSCAHPITFPEFLRKRRIVDVILLPKSGTVSVTRKCAPDLQREINTFSNTGTFRKGVGKEDKVIDTIGGVLRVGEIACVPVNITAAEIDRHFPQARALMLMTPDDRFLATPWGDVCGGIPSSIRFYPPLAHIWVSTARRVVEERFPDPSSFACIHIRMEKLVRHAVLNDLAKWKWSDNGTRVSSEVLDNCIEAIDTVVTMEVNRKVGRDAGKRFMITDMQSEYGTVTEHVDTKDDLRAYREWWPRTAQHFAKQGSGFCGTEQHRRYSSGESTVAGILRGNPRACALTEAAVCREAPVAIRFGGGSFSNFATAGKGSFYSSCPAIIAAAHGKPSQ